MFAYVVFCEDNVSAVVNTADIKKFDTNVMYPKEKTFKVKYEDGHYYRAFVIETAETPEEVVAKATEKRIKIPNKKNIEVTSTDEDGNNNEIHKNYKKNDNKKFRNENFNEIMKNIETQDDGDDIETLNEKKLKSKLLEKDKVIKELESQLEEYKKLNTQLQKCVINKFQELNEHFQKKNTMVEKETPADIGERRGDRVHLGRDMWLDQRIFDNIYRKKKHTIFLKELSVALFGEEELKKSSLTGGPSNRTKEPGRPPLNATKLLAMQDILKYRMNEQGCRQEDVIITLRNFDKIINEKIQDLRRSGRPRTKKNGKEAVTEMEGDVDVELPDLQITDMEGNMQLLPDLENAIIEFVE